FSTVALIAVSAYIACQMLADVTSNKIGNLFGLAVDMGTFIYPLTFTLRDLVHKQLGKRNARLVIVIAGVINLFMAAYLWFTAAFPSDGSFAYHEAFAAIFAVTPRIVIASIIAEVVSELVDTEIYHWFVTRVTRRHQWARVLISNSVSVPLDSLIFSLGAFAFFLPWEAVWGIFLVNIIIKYMVTVVSIPLIYAVPERNHDVVQP
ncbi:MAG TPA: VUT family protein, partial [Spirochaetia bacterium]|nr:VUT family protein [Spirochaetia bacterium]